jgi:hypothetical protein
MSNVQSGLVYAMGIDPGGTSGWGVIGVERDSIFGDAPSIIRHFNYGEVTGRYTSQVLKLREIAADYHDPFYTLAIAAESFFPRKPITSEEYFSPIEVNARIQFLKDTNRIKAPLFYQPPSLAMKTASDKRLLKWGLYVAGPDHIKDGIRHAITFIRRCKADPDLRETAWPTFTEASIHPIRQLVPKWKP